MRKKVKITIDRCTCDVCGAESYEWQQCWGCGGDFCRKHMVEYGEGVHFSSYDAYYCVKCVEKLSEKPNSTFAAYYKIQELRREYACFYADFDRRMKVAERETARIAEERRAR